jgi:hypothetical protein
VVEVVHGYRAAAVGRKAYISPVIPDLLGRPALTFAQWVEAHADEFRG